MSQNRYVVVPTVTVLAVMKARLTGAVKGHALLKKKADALTVRCIPSYSAASALEIGGRGAFRSLVCRMMIWEQCQTIHHGMS